MDDIDLLILKEIWNQDNDPTYLKRPRYTVDELGRKVGKSAGATQSRLEAMRKQGLVVTYTRRPGRSIRITPRGKEFLVEAKLIREAVPESR